MRKAVADQANTQRVAEALITLHGTTTSLDVKDQLRNEGFWAEQTPVSNFMQQIAASEGYNVVVDSTTHPGKTYNRYSKASNSSGSNSNSNTFPATVNFARATTVDAVAAAINKVFGFSAQGSDKFEDLGIDTPSALVLVIDEAASDFNFDKSKFDGTDFEPAAIIVWREKTIIDFAALIDTFIAAPVQQVSPAVVAATTVNQVAAAHTTKSRKPRQRATAKPLFVIPSTTDNRTIVAGYNSTDWVVFTGTTDRCIYSGSETRDQVRSAYATAYNVKIQRVRSRRVMNINKP